MQVHAQSYSLTFIAAFYEIREEKNANHLVIFNKVLAVCANKRLKEEGEREENAANFTIS